MTHPILIAIEQGLNKLTTYQNSNGSFSSITIPENCLEQTTFYTSLIIDCLSAIPAFEIKNKIINQGVTFLKKELSPYQTTNYFPRADESYYPDDLDDTFLSLIAIASYDRNYFDTEKLISIVQLLIKQECQPGGPYFTWIIDSNNRNSWDNIDPVVNNSIARFLDLYNIHLGALDKFIKESITKNNPSDFYTSSIVRYYFFTKRELGLREKDTKNTLPGNDLEIIMQLSRQLRCGLDPLFIRNKIPWIINLVNKSHIAYPVFVERVSNNKISYSGCAGFTLAVAIECLGLYYQKINLSLLPSPGFSHDLALVRQLSFGYFTPFTGFNELLGTYIEKISKNDINGTIQLLPLYFYRNLKPSLQNTITIDEIYELCSASLFGWIGYTLLDDVIDNEESRNILPFASLCIQLCSEIFNEKIYHLPESKYIISKILGEIHTYNSWEINNNHCNIINGEQLILPLKIPDYSDITVISTKSFGYALAPLIITMIMKFDYEITYINALVSFFRKILTVRQLNDDMHDWYEDFSTGYISPAVALLIKKQQELFPDIVTINIITNKKNLQEIFWEFTYPELCNTITLLLYQAECDLSNCDFLVKENILKKILDQERNQFHEALAQHQQTIDFLSTYKKATVSGGCN